MLYDENLIIFVLPYSEKDVIIVDILLVVHAFDISCPGVGENVIVDVVVRREGRNAG